MPLPTFSDLHAFADQLPQPVPVVAAGGADVTVIQALDIARRKGWVSPLLSGESARIKELAANLDIELEGFTLLEDAPDSASAAVQAVRDGRAQLLMKGQISTPALMKAVLNRETGLRTDRVIGQLVLMEIVRDRRVFLMSDTGVTVDPTVDQKADLLQSMLETARHLGCQQPRIALMSATEKPTPAMPDTAAAVELVQRAERGDFGPCSVAGPLSFDLAYAVDAGHKKGISGAVTGAADGMLFPNLLAGNLTVKALMYAADCRFGGMLCGTAAPVVFMSRADTVETRLNSLAYTLRLSQSEM